MTCKKCNKEWVLRPLDLAVEDVLEDKQITLYCYCPRCGTTHESEPITEWEI